MTERTRYFVLREDAVPPVLFKVMEAREQLASGQAGSVQEAIEAVGISRSSFYKYRDAIFPFRGNAKGTTITMMMQMEDEPGLLSSVLQSVANYHANILTIHQSIPTGGVASLTLSLEVRKDTGDLSRMAEEIEEKEGIHYFKILEREQERREL